MTNKDYELKRDALIPKAVKHANKKHGRKANGDPTTWAWQWNKTYHEKMNKLALVLLDGRDV